MSKPIRILWTDDEIDLLKPYILFLEEKGYEVSTASNGEEALDLVAAESYNLIFLDENMPGLSGLETLERIKNISPSVPVIMITKSEEEDIMDEAIGSKIADYLIKPVNPKQILLTIKKHIDTRRLVTRKTTSAYQVQFSQIGSLINTANSFDDWVNIYKKLVFWEQELEVSDETGMNQVLSMQWSEANSEFTRFIKKNYRNWFRGEDTDRPVLSPQVFAKAVFPLLEKGKVAVLVIDNLRYDQWKLIEQEINDLFRVEEEIIFCSILPTATQYARNAMFAGLMPAEIKKLMPEYWIEEEDEESKNLFESELLRTQLQRKGIRNSMHYEKINNQKQGKRIVDSFSDLLNYDLNVLVYNFVDMLSHARTEMDVIKELAYDDRTYRALTLTWFNNSYLLDLIRLLSENNVQLVLTTDHGAVRVQHPVKVVGDRKTSANLRYKQGRNLSFQSKEVFEISNPGDVHLPQTNVSTSYIFAGGNDYMVYPNNYNHFVNYYRNTFQHGGISLEEMIIPCAVMSPR
ncbi:MAG: bifunctional response regulator/alkaline phosphatase family protein [Bacteroidales bacterium]|nr:bifunctional response regulator/alkaline phosphatase family protein [Bacteroidales bacterium]MDT8432820.1 bifunctional response regulator/alkaline phosphatase family protein [Bacteroidales bacterium]